MATRLEAHQSFSLPVSLAVKAATSWASWKTPVSAFTKDLHKFLFLNQKNKSLIMILLITNIRGEATFPSASTISCSQ